MNRPGRALIAAACTIAGYSGASRRAQACAACGSGDPTLTTMGTSQPFAGRIRASVNWTHRTDRVGRPRVDQIRLDEHRWEASVAWAPFDFWFLGATLPFLSREVRYANLGQGTTLALGDAQLRNKLYLWKDRTFAARHLLAVDVGMKLPTAPLERRSNGTLLPLELQPGTGSVDPLLGVSYAYSALPWSAYASVTGFYPTPGSEGYQASASLRSTVSAQHQPATWLALRFGLDARLDGHALEGGDTEPDTGGFILFVSPAVLWSPLPDLLVTATVQVPAWNALEGKHLEGAITNTAVTWDF